jgi:response regulator RpfG family c-di-GMP phosphodiesterase
VWSPTWIGERLRAEGLITASQLNSALRNMQIHDERMEEALLRIGAIDEARLLGFVSERCRVRYVSTQKLAQLEVPAEVLRAVPERAAERLLAFPVRLDQDGFLSLVSPDAGDPEYVKQIGIATGVKNVKVYLARPAAVSAAIAKWYRGEIQAFAEIAPETFVQIQSAVDMYERQLLSEAGLDAKARKVAVPEREQRAQREPRIKTPLPAQRPPVRAAIPIPLEPPPLPDSATVPVARPVAAQDRRVSDLGELLNVLVALNENARDEFRGHSASVARLCRMVAKRLGLEETVATQLAIASNMHDLGKTVSYHLTALNVAQSAPHRAAAQKLAMTPVRLLESVGLPAPATAAVAGMYERFDGQGFPQRLAGKAVPIGSRVLALCDSYSDLTQNPRNPYRRVLSGAEAMQILQRFAASVFDPDLVELLGSLVVGEDLKRRLGGEASKVLLVEPEPEEATILELRLVAQGFEVQVARSADQALQIAGDGNVNFILSEVELEPFDGFALLEHLRGHEATRTIPFLFVARASDTATIDRGFSLGAQDYVVKPTSGDVLAGKLRRLAPKAQPPSQRPQSKADVSGVSGSLSDMGLPDLVQILGHSRKGGRLTVRSNGRNGEVHFEAGRIVHAVLGELTGNDAFYELLTFAQGSFSLDPSFVPSTQTIQSSSDMLILEGLRRLDERSRDQGIA